MKSQKANKAKPNEKSVGKQKQKERTENLRQPKETPKQNKSFVALRNTVAHEGYCKKAQRTMRRRRGNDKQNPRKTKKNTTTTTTSAAVATPICIKIRTVAFDIVLGHIFPLVLEVNEVHVVAGCTAERCVLMRRHGCGAAVAHVTSKDRLAYSQGFKSSATQ